MHKDTLPLKIDPVRFAEHKTHLQGTLLVKDMPRLLPSLAGPEGEIEVEMTFGIDRDKERTRFVKGKFNGEIILQCQRCMQPFKYAIIGDFVLGIVQTEKEAEALSERYDPVFVKDGMLFPSDLIEDELLVDLPIVPMHDVSDCRIKLPLVAGNAVSVEKENPFKVIESLRVSRDVK